MLDVSDWDRLDVAAYRVSMKRSVRRLAWIMTLVGPGLVGFGIALPSMPLGILGVLVLAAGAWNLARPAVSGLAVDGAAMILAGLFQCLAFLWFEPERTSSAGKWVVAGAIHLYWGVRRLLLHRTARRAVNDPKAIARLEGIVRAVSRRSAKDDPSIAEFRTGRFHLTRNRLGLLDPGVVGLLEHTAVRLEKRSDIWIETRGTTGLGRTLKVVVRMGDLELQGRMSAEHYERFEQWKRGLARSHPIAA